MKTLQKWARSKTLATPLRWALLGVIFFLIPSLNLNAGLGTEIFVKPQPANLLNPLDATLPPGFAISLLSNNLPSPTHIAFAPDGRIFVSLKGGQLRIIKEGVLLATPFLTVDTDTAGEQGLIGVAFDPSFDTNFYVYVYYMAKTPTPHARVSRFTANGDVAVERSEKIILDLDDRGTSIFHVAGGMLFGNDGKLYIASGDNAGYPFVNNSQNLNSTLGKLLRINSDGSIPADNPFREQTTGVAQSIWAYGLRNPFSFSISRLTDRLFVNDVGQTFWEEINDVVAGGNYGWPLVEGMGTRPQYKNPIYAYAHGVQSATEKGCAITGGTFYEPFVPQFPVQYFGKYFFMDFCNNWIRVFDPLTGAVSPFGTNVTSSGLGVTTGPDGSLYLLSAWFNSIYRIHFTGSEAPQLISQPEDQIIPLGQPVTFKVNVSGSAPITYQWRRNGVLIPAATTHTFTLDAVTLGDDSTQFDCVITNTYGTVTSRNATLHVLNATPPTASIDYPETGLKYSSGDRVYFGGSARDQIDGVLLPKSYTWNVYFHHNTHFHPFILDKTGVTAGYFQIPTQGESSENTWFRIVLTVKNSVGLTTQITREIFPNKSVFLLKSNPPGLQLTLDGQILSSPAYTTGVVGFTRSLGVLSPQTFNGVSYEFTSWSDAGTATHSIRTSVSNRTYTANFMPVGSPRSATLRATPNPVMVCDGSGAGVTTLNWTTKGTRTTELRIGSPRGNMLARSYSGSGTFTTPKWVGNESTFYLQDTTSGLPLTQENTLATVTVNLTSYGCASLLTSP